jgi:signal transduction histidine kinase
MDGDSLETYAKLSESISKGDWKKAFNSLFLTLRKIFVFDNLTIYLPENDDCVPEPVFARAAGRGRSKEADASWGEEIANQVMSSSKIVMNSPKDTAEADRIRKPYLLGLPIPLPNGCGALVFVRFGGPEYTSDQMSLAMLAAIQVGRIFERRLLNETQSQLEIARQRSQFQDDFIATISHDLHTPLGFIKGYTTSLLRSDTVWDPDTQREFLGIIDDESDYLIKLIDRILDSARLQSGSMQIDFQPVRLDSILRDVIIRFQVYQKDLQVIQDIQPAQPIQADAVRLAQVISNLIENAIKYAPGSDISVSLQQGSDKQIITVSDHGPGISSEHLPYLFERFYRAPGHSTKRGTGLGLYICKQIIRAHHGQIRIKTSLGEGTAFIIELPIHASNPIRKE